MVVDDVEEHGQAAAVAGVDQTLEPVRPTVGMMWRVEIDAVIAPAAASGKFSHRHQLDMSDAELDQMVELIDGADEGSFRCEGADMKLVDHGGRKRRRLPPSIRPAKSVVIDGREGP